ncbi:MAG TPA: hypothetical protein G4N98_03470 [Thermoflexia bacterium]|nr:hypothetical protein [Thermoflexia bacterium]
MRSRTVILTLMLALVIIGTAIGPQALSWVRAERSSGAAAIKPAAYYPPGYLWAHVFVPFVTKGTVCIAVTGVTITGETSGEPGEYTFSTSVVPADATTPSYLWDNGDTTAATTRTLSNGTHTLTVAVSNSCGSATDEHEIKIGAYP